MIQLPPTVTTPEDLLAEFERTGDTAPFEEIVRRYSGMVYGVCYRVTRNAHDAEDATQATFLKLATHARLGFVSPRTGQGGGVPRVGPWLQQVAKTTAVDLRRSKSRRHNREQIRAAIEEQQQAISDATDDASMDELKQVLRDEVDRLPVHYRTPLILYYFGGMSTEQIAVELKTNAKALAVRLFRARKMLGTRLTARGVATAGGLVGSLAVADAILASLAGTVFKTGGAGSLYAAGGAGSTFLSSWATSHSAICATITSRINSTLRAAAIGMVASKWKMSLAMLLTVGTTMAGTSEMVQQAPVVRDLGRVIEQIGQALRDLGSVGQKLRSATPNLQAAAEQPQAPLPESAAIVPVPPMKIEPPAWPAAQPAAVPSRTIASQSPTASRPASAGSASAGTALTDPAESSVPWVSGGPSAPLQPPGLSRPGALDKSASAMLLAMNDHATSGGVGRRHPAGRGVDGSAIGLPDGKLSPRSDAEGLVGPVAMAAPDFSSLRIGDLSGRVGPYSHGAGGSTPQESSPESSPESSSPGGATGVIATGPVDDLVDITSGQTPDNLLIASGRDQGDLPDPGGVTPELPTYGKGLDFIDPTVLTQPAVTPPATQPIPEPAVAGLLALGAMGLLARRRRSTSGSRLS